MIANKEEYKLTPSRKKMLKKVDDAMEVLDKQINNPDGIDEDKLKELMEMKEKLEKSKKVIKKRNYRVHFPF